MNRLAILALSGILVTLLAAPIAWESQAEGAPGRGPIPFSEIDTNGDGVISEEEFEAARARRMKERAKDGRPPGRAGSAHGFEDLDADGDGGITEEELEAGRKRRRGGGSGRCLGKGSNAPSFGDFDTDGDGYISEKELQEGRAKRMQERAAEGRQLKHHADAPTFGDIDTDGDGRISPAEFERHQRECRASKSQ